MDQKDLHEEDGFSAVIGNILSNPEMLSSIKAMADQIKSGSSPTSNTPESAPQKDTATPSEAKMQDAITALAPLLAASSPKKDDKQACLLRALKPYLSQNRCNAIEYIIKFSTISDIIKNLS